MSSELRESEAKDSTQLKGFCIHLHSDVNADEESNIKSSFLEQEKGNRATLLTLASNEPGNPHSWSAIRKTLIAVTLMLAILNSCIGSSLPSNAVPFIMKEFSVEPRLQKALPITVYLLGYVFGPIVWAPISEKRGRRNITIGTCVLFTLFTMACALAPNWPVFLVFRLFTGIFGSAPIVVVTGALADIYPDHRTRGQAVAIYMVVTAFGPLLGPIISGFVSPTLGWRWSFWIALIFAGVTIFPLLALPETNVTTSLSLKAAEVDKHHSKGFIKEEAPKPGCGKSLTIHLPRPLQMLIFEPIVSASSAYLALIYAIFYMTFQAYTIIFQDLYGFAPGTGGLMYLPIGAGCILSLPTLWLYDRILCQAERNKKSWVNVEEYRRLPLACLGGPLFALSLFWLGRSAQQDISFAVPMMAGVPFGFGFICIFTALMNYMTDAYGAYAASANAASSCSRSLLATILPLATTPMFEKLGIFGTCSLLGGLSALMCVIPFLFIWKGDKIRASSKLCNVLKVWQEDVFVQNVTLELACDQV